MSLNARTKTLMREVGAWSQMAKKKGIKFVADDLDSMRYIVNNFILHNRKFILSQEKHGLW